MTHHVPGRMVEVSWTHPVHGELRERLCERHEGEVLRCLSVLGIGCSGEVSMYTVGCRRCANSGHRPAFFVKESKA